MSELKTAAKILYWYTKLTYSATWWKDGDGFSFLFHFWNPLAWPLVLFVLLITVLCVGLQGLREDASELGFKMSNYWKEHRDEREFF